VIDMTFTHHVISNLNFEKNTNQVDTLWIGRDHVNVGVMRFAAKIGYRTPASQNRFLFDAYAGASLFKKVSFGVGLSRSNLMESIPLPQEAFDLIQDSVHGRIGWDETVEVQSAIAKDWNLPAFSRHKLKIDTPLSLFGAQYGTVYGLFGIDYESRQRPSPDYETFRQGLRAHMGGRLERRIRPDSLIQGELRYLNIHRQGHGMSSWIQNSGIGLNVSLRHALDQKWSINARLAYNGEETLRPTQPFQNRVDIRVGAQLLK
jgi:hypothetical protein